MEAKLIKKDNGYYMTHEPTGWYIGFTDHEKVKNFKGEQGLLKLSLKNCQAIERGYDLDKLAMKWFEGKGKNIYTDYNTMPSFIAGFQKALEIRSDKKFSSRNMLKAFITGVFTDETSDYDFEFTELMQDLQQTEWDVEIVMEYVGKIKLNKLNEMKPKLDADGCLILKRKI